MTTIASKRPSTPGYKRNLPILPRSVRDGSRRVPSPGARRMSQGAAEPHSSLRSRQAQRSKWRPHSAFATLVYHDVGSHSRLLELRHRDLRLSPVRRWLPASGLLKSTSPVAKAPEALPLSKAQLPKAVWLTCCRDRAFAERELWFHEIRASSRNGEAHFRSWPHD